MMQILVKNTASSFLAQWQGMDKKLHYSISDPPTQVEMLLTR